MPVSQPETEWAQALGTPCAIELYCISNTGRTQCEKPRTEYFGLLQ